MREFVMTPIVDVCFPTCFEGQCSESASSEWSNAPCDHAALDDDDESAGEFATEVAGGGALGAFTGSVGNKVGLDEAGRRRGSAVVSLLHQRHHGQWGRVHGSAGALSFPGQADDESVPVLLVRWW